MVTWTAFAILAMFAGGSGLTETHGSHLQISPASSLFGAGRDLSQDVIFARHHIWQDTNFYKTADFKRLQILQLTLVSKPEGVTLSKINVGVAWLMWRAAGGRCLSSNPQLNHPFSRILSRGHESWFFLVGHHTVDHHDLHHHQLPASPTTHQHHHYQPSLFSLSATLSHTNSTISSNNTISTYNTIHFSSYRDASW